MSWGIMKHHKLKFNSENTKRSWFRPAAVLGLFSILFILGFFYLNDHPGINRLSTYTTSKTVEKNTSESDFQAFLQLLFQNEIQSNTLNLHYTLADPASAGITRYPVTLGEMSSENSTSQSASLENLKSELKTFDTSSMSVASQLAYDVLEDSVNRNLELAPFYFYNEPLSPTNGAQSEYPILLAEYAFYSKEDIENYLSLLNQYDTYFNQVCTFEKEKAKQGLFMNETAAENLISQCRAFLPSGKEQSFWETTFAERIKETQFLTDKEKNSYIKLNKTALEEHVYPAYHNLIAVIKALKKSGKNPQGLCHFKDGQKYYEMLVKSSTGSKRSVPELQKMVEKRRNKALSEMTLLASINEQPDSDTKTSEHNSKQTTSDLTTAISYHLLPYQSPEDMLEHLKKEAAKAFPEAPAVNYTVKEVNKKLEKFLAPAFYLTAPIDQFTENCIYINPDNHYNDIELFTTLAHEGYPGHLYQNVYACSRSLAPIRYILYHGGYTEGWATYVEMLSYDYAGIDENTARLLMLNQDATLSLYAAIDMGVHYDGWTLADTADFLGTCNITDSTVISNIYQAVIQSPANYLKYYIGYLEFLNLKNSAKDYYKNDYSELLFHTAVLEMGSAPFYILEKYLPHYYDAAK